MGVTLGAPEILTVIALASGLSTAIWHAAMYIGKLTVKVERHEDRLNDHDDELRFVKGLR